VSAETRVRVDGLRLIDGLALAWLLDRVDLAARGAELDDLDVGAELAAVEPDQPKTAKAA
jgi:hypothetical protein